jgi:PhnB protein
VEDRFYADLSGTVADPFGHWWTDDTHQEDVPPEELKRRFDGMMKQKG